MTPTGHIPPHYKTDTKDTPQFGLIAEEVAKVNPALGLPDKEGKPYTVRYDAVNAMMLNEFLKEHKRVEEQQSEIEKQQAAIARQQKQIEALTAGLQKVSARLEDVREPVHANGCERSVRLPRPRNRH